MGEKYCDFRVCMSVCLSFSSHISKTVCPNFTNSSVHHVSPSSYDIATCYVLPVSWMTSCSHKKIQTNWRIRLLWLAALLIRFQRLWFVSRFWRYIIFLCMHVCMWHEAKSALDDFLFKCSLKIFISAEWIHLVGNKRKTINKLI